MRITRKPDFTTIYPDAPAVSGYVRTKKSEHIDTGLYLEVGGSTQSTHLTREETVALIVDMMTRTGITAADLFPGGHRMNPVRLPAEAWAAVENALAMAQRDCTRSVTDNTRDAVWADHEGRTANAEQSRGYAEAAQEGADEYGAVLRQIREQRAAGPPHRRVDLLGALREGASRGWDPLTTIGNTATTTWTTDGVAHGWDIRIRPADSGALPSPHGDRRETCSGAPIWVGPVPQPCACCPHVTRCGVACRVRACPPDPARTHNTQTFW